MADVKKILLQIINGVRVPVKFEPKCLREAIEYKPTSGDVIICTYPKCGTTWMQNVVLMILRNGKSLERPKEFRIASPFIDMNGAESVGKMPRPGAIKTHLPYDVMPYSPDAKYVIVIRNPMDTCVSLYYHTRDRDWDGEFRDFFEFFMSGEVEYGDYFDHLLSWFPHRNDKNVFYTTYEDMKKDLKSVVLKLADFIGEEYSKAIQTDPKVLDNILCCSDFLYMKSAFSELYDLRKKRRRDHDVPEEPVCEENSITPEPPRTSRRVGFFRKGVVGNWREHFTSEQLARMKEKFEIKTAGTEIPNLWPDLFS